MFEHIEEMQDARDCEPTERELILHDKTRQQMEENSKLKHRLKQAGVCPECLMTIAIDPHAVNMELYCQCEEATK